MDITYTLSLTVTRPVRANDYDDTTADVAEWMRGKDALRELEKEILQALRKIDGDCDCEVMETEQSAPEDEPQTIADTGCDTWAEYRGER